jgi:hypothetical protein
MCQDTPAATLRRLGLVTAGMSTPAIVLAVDVVVQVKLLPAQDLLPAQAAGHTAAPYPLLPEDSEFAVLGAISPFLCGQAPSHENQLERVPGAPLKASSPETS